MPVQPSYRGTHDAWYFPRYVQGMSLAKVAPGGMEALACDLGVKTTASNFDREPSYAGQKGPRKSQRLLYYMRPGRLSAARNMRPPARLAILGVLRSPSGWHCRMETFDFRGRENALGRHWVAPSLKNLGRPNLKKMVDDMKA